MLLLSVLEKFVVNVWVFTSPRVSPVFFKQSGGPNQRPHWAVRSFLSVNMLRALSHTVAVYDPELHPKKKFAVVRPAHSYMQIDECICKQLFREHFSSRSIAVHTLDDSAALSANLVVYSPTSPRQTVTQGNVMDPGSESDMIQLKKAIASAGNAAFLSLFLSPANSFQ